MFKKYFFFVAGILITLIDLNAQNTKQEEHATCTMPLPLPKCGLPKQPKGEYYQNTEQYTNGVGNDSVIRYIKSELSVILNLKKRKKATLLVRQSVSRNINSTTFAYLYEKKGNWKMQSDTVTIVWKYQKEPLSTKWLHLAKTETLKLKYERDYKTNYPVIECKSALIPNNKNPFIGYGN